MKLSELMEKLKLLEIGKHDPEVVGNLCIIDYKNRNICKMDILEETSELFELMRY